MDTFFGIGPLEFIFVLIFALIFLGPERLPGVLREFKGFLRQVQAIVGEITQQFNEELSDLKELQDLDPRRQVMQILSGDAEKQDARCKQMDPSKTQVPASAAPSTGAIDGTAPKAPASIEE